MTQAGAIKAPGAFLLALEGRAPWELGGAIAAYPLLRLAARGDGHPVVVFPGLAANDMTTLPLRAFLRAHGYRPSGWDMRFNLGPREGVLERCVELVARVRRGARRKVSLVGWSLGGVYAREIAKLLPGDVRCVVTLGSPFAGHAKANNAWRLYELASGQSLDGGDAFARLAGTPPVPTTSIFSRSDGIVAWPCCVQQPGPRAESIEVASSHIGMGFNPAAWYAVADRLAQPEGRWRPFHREGWREWIYADPYRALGRG
jgi:pimeloyl-ACP methyl ester carboxylesterase